MRGFVSIVMLVLTLALVGVAQAAPPIRIGGLFSVTGPASFLGEPERNTLEMLVKEINATGGVN
ncbi:MAG TPA: transporter substrate-binding protein, partial [Geobacteraceae bacterium]|nr:transporter substrate-binding protein [Geobacteraceae bacterium]